MQPTVKKLLSWADGIKADEIGHYSVDAKGYIVSEPFAGQPDIYLVRVTAMPEDRSLIELEIRDAYSKTVVTTQEFPRDEAVLYRTPLDAVLAHMLLSRPSWDLMITLLDMARRIET